MTPRLGAARQALGQADGVSGDGLEERMRDDGGHGTMNLRQLQAAVGEWVDRNFDRPPSWRCLLKVGEEVGELMSAHSHREDGTKNGVAVARAKQLDAVGDIIIGLLGYCNAEGIDAQAALEQTWAEVRLRDWKANPLSGEAAPMPLRTPESHEKAPGGAAGDSEAIRHETDGRMGRS